MYTCFSDNLIELRLKFSTKGTFVLNLVNGKFLFNPKFCSYNET
jgi:hypothetical protein